MLISSMDNRLLAWLVLAASGLYSLIMILKLLSLHFQAQFGPAAWFVGIVGVAAGVRLLWSTGLYRHSPLWKFQSIASFFLAASFIMRIMHWPYYYACMLLALASMMGIYGTHFVLKPRKALRDILRLLVVVLSTTAVGMAYMHVIPPYQALWIIVGIVSIAMVEFLFNPVDAFDPPTPPNTKSKPAADEPSDDKLADEHPELFQ